MLPARLRHLDRFCGLIAEVIVRQLEELQTTDMKTPAGDKPAGVAQPNLKDRTHRRQDHEKDTSPQRARTAIP
jgi:hypothetical protein